eukprot:5236473-Alexandrium_andersonii.AAC.1
MPKSGITWTCPCGAENWNSRKRCRGCKAAYAPSWQEHDSGRAADRQNSWLRNSRKELPKPK